MTQQQRAAEQLFRNTLRVLMHTTKRSGDDRLWTRTETEMEAKALCARLREFGIPAKHVNLASGWAVLHAFLKRP